jgi:hypothetical protein
MLTAIAVLALLLPDEMVNALLGEIERQANDPPLMDRKKRIAQLQAEIDALGAVNVPPQVMLQVRVTRVQKERVA